MKKEREDLREVVDPILQIAFPDGTVEGVPSAWHEHLKLVPKRMKAQLKETAMIGTAQALAVFKSHYPRVDLQRFGEGFTADVDEDKFDSLMLEVTPAVELLVENLNLEYL